MICLLGVMYDRVTVDISFEPHLAYEQNQNDATTIEALRSVSWLVVGVQLMFCQRSRGGSFTTHHRRIDSF